MRGLRVQGFGDSGLLGTPKVCRIMATHFGVVSGFNEFRAWGLSLALAEGLALDFERCQEVQTGFGIGARLRA